MGESSASSHTSGAGRHAASQRRGCPRRTPTAPRRRRDEARPSPGRETPKRDSAISRVGCGSDMPMPAEWGRRELQPACQAVAAALSGRCGDAGELAHLYHSPKCRCKEDVGATVAAAPPRLTCSVPPQAQNSSGVEGARRPWCGRRQPPTGRSVPCSHASLLRRSFTSRTKSSQWVIPQRGACGEHSNI